MECCKQWDIKCEECLRKMDAAMRETLRSVGLDDSPAPPEVNTEAWLHQHYASRLPAPRETGEYFFFGTWCAAAGSGIGALSREGSGYFRGWPSIPEGVRTWQTPAPSPS